MEKRPSCIEDFDGVLARLSGSEELLDRLLDKFRVTYHDSRGRLLGYLAEGNHEDAYRLVHSLKGVSSNLGVGSLYRLAVALENRMRSGFYDAQGVETEAFLSELDRVIVELDRLASGE
jgi:HPt (histidine-containing phosphotransfer) domain-containing protein